MSERMPIPNREELDEEHGDITVNLRASPIIPEKPVSIPPKPQPKEETSPRQITAWPNEIIVPDYTTEDLEEMQTRAQSEPARGAPKPDLFVDDIPNADEIIKEQRSEEKAEAKNSWWQRRISNLRRSIFKKN